eukprot:747290-Hanusia_phi.AAC.1
MRQKLRQLEALTSEAGGGGLCGDAGSVCRRRESDRWIIGEASLKKTPDGPFQRPRNLIVFVNHPPPPSSISLPPILTFHSPQERSAAQRRSSGSSHSAFRARESSLSSSLTLQPLDPSNSPSSR